MKKQGLDLSSHLKQLKKPAQIVREENSQDNGHKIWRTVILRQVGLRGEWGVPFSCFSLRPRESFQATPQEEMTQAEPGSLLELRRWSCNTNEAKAPRNHRAVYQRGVHYRISAEGFHQVFSRLFISTWCEESIQGLEKNYLKWLEEIASHYTELGTVPPPNTQCWKPHNSRCFWLSTKEVLIVGKN